MWATRAGGLAIGFWLLVAAGGCGDGGGDKTVTIGVLAPLDAGLTQFGRGIRNSVQLAVDEARDAQLLPGWTLRVVAVDDSSDPTSAAANARGLLDDPTVIGVVGTYNSGVAAAVAPALKSAGIAMISPGNTDPSLTLGPDRDHPRRPSDYVLPHGRQRRAAGRLPGAESPAELGHRIRSPSSPTPKPVSLGLANDFRAAFSPPAAPSLSFEVVPDGDTDYAPYAQRAAATPPDPAVLRRRIRSCRAAQSRPPSRPASPCR